MPAFALLISPRADAAYFADVLKVARAELSGLTDAPCDVLQAGDMQFLTLEHASAQDLTRLSFVQGLFDVSDGQFRPVDASAAFDLHPDFVWGEKYRGKTNETLTQLLINVALQQAQGRSGLRLLDPMCGRGTSLLWAQRYGFDAVGIEQDARVLPELRRGLKKWSKLHRQKHKLSEGWVQKANKKEIGKYLDFETKAHMRVVIGDTLNARDLTQRKPFDLIVTDLPYGVQHMGPKGQRSVLETLQSAAPEWSRCLAPGGAMAIAFNANLPKRPELEAVFTGLEVVQTDLAHRMSESILRDVLLLRKP